MRSYQQIKEILPPGTVLMVLDFGRNRTIKHQNEAKEAGYSARQVTFHPVVMYYVENNMKVRDSMIILSDDIIHDHVAVNRFLHAALEYLRDSKKITIGKVFVYSDGCASQYKGKGTVGDISMMDEPIEWSYFGSDHGKSECDGEVAVVNKALDSAILSRHIILNDATEMTEWCNKDKLAEEHLHSVRHFHVINDIDRIYVPSFAPLVGIQKLHNIASTKKENTVVYRAKLIRHTQVTTLGLTFTEYSKQIVPWMRQERPFTFFGLTQRVAIDLPGHGPPITSSHFCR